MEQIMNIMNGGESAGGVSPVRKSSKERSSSEKKSENMLKPLLREKVDINSTLKNIYRRFRSTTLLKGLEFRYDTTLDGYEAEILTDGKLLELIISSLILHSLAVTENGYISFGYMKRDEYIEFYVADTGKGLSGDITDNVSVDKQLKASITFPGINVNAGINDCKVLVKTLGGMMRIKSDPWEGSVFLFTIPYIKELG
jgi:K+-sensing histidine kinase KdpD